MIEIAVNNKSCTDYPTECRYGTDSTDMLKLKNTAHLCGGVSEPREVEFFQQSGK